MDIRPNQRVETNRRFACPLDAGQELGRIVCAQPWSPAAVAHAYRWGDSPLALRDSNLILGKQF